MQELQAELKAAKELWAKEVELSKGEKGSPNYPFPVAVTRYVPRPESAAFWDCEELPVRLVVSSAEPSASSVSVEVPPIFPGKLPVEMEKAVEKEWQRLLAPKKGKATAAAPAAVSWKVKETLEWVEAHFGDLLRLVPEHVDCYIGCDDMGASCRRYTLVGEAVEEEEEEEEEEDEQEQERRMQEYIERESARIEAELGEQSKDAEAKRKLAEQGIFEEGQKIRQLSKKEQAEQNKSRKERSGHRWRKTGSKSHKPVRDEAEEKKLKEKKK